MNQLTTSNPTTDVPGIGEKTASLLKKSNILSVKDLLENYPKKHIEFQSKNIRDISIDDFVMLSGSISKPYSKKAGYSSTQTSSLKDASGTIMIRWFNQPYIVRSIKSQTNYQVQGQVTIFAGKLQIINPLLSITNQPTSTKIFPVYRQIGSLKSGSIKAKISSALKNIKTLFDPIPKAIRSQHNLIDRAQAIQNIHFPSNWTTLEKSIHRLAFEELFLLQRKTLQESPSKKENKHPISVSAKTLKAFTSKLNFSLTASQNQVIKEITKDLSKPHYMNRLLQGDVGSGKTVVAAISAYPVVLQGHQVLVMAPTVTLANQLFDNLSAYFTLHNLTTKLITGSIKPKGHFDILVGTHAILNQEYPNAKLIIIDEEHKFGVKQKTKLQELSQHTHTLSMTATPIPRTLALTSLGHRDISRLVEMPKNRKKVKTYLVPERKRLDAYNWIRNLITNKQLRVFVVSPLIEESEYVGTKHLKSAKATFEELKKIFPNQKLDLLHGKMSDLSKNQKIKEFKQGKTNILVSTTIIEVGIDIPQANVIIIESAERFGLSQLHQLRGRVGRSNIQGHCLLFASHLSPKSHKRLKYFTKYNSGEKLAAIDMALRGPGELYGTSQHGFFNLKIANIFDTKLLSSTLQAAKDSLSA